MPERDRAEHGLPRRLSVAQRNRCRRKTCLFYAGMRAAWGPPGLREFAHGENEEMGEVIGEKKADDSQAVVVEISADVDVENEKKHGDFPAAVCGTFLEYKDEEHENDENETIFVERDDEKVDGVENEEKHGDSRAAVCGKPFGEEYKDVENVTFVEREEYGDVENVTAFVERDDEKEVDDDSPAVVSEDLENEEKHGDFPAAVCGKPLGVAIVVEREEYEDVENETAFVEHEKNVDDFPAAVCGKPLGEEYVENETTLVEREEYEGFEYVEREEYGDVENETTFVEREEYKDVVHKMTFVEREEYESFDLLHKYEDLPEGCYSRMVMKAFTSKKPHYFGLRRACHRWNKSGNIETCKKFMNEMHVTFKIAPPEDMPEYIKQVFRWACKDANHT